MRQILLLSFLFFSFFIGFGQCPTSGVFTSQAQIDQFAIDFPDCTELNDWLRIVGDDVTDLTPLSNLTSVQGLRIIGTENLINLDGLEGLVSIDGNQFGDFVIDDNESLEDIDALINLQAINLTPGNSNHFEISGNDVLTNLDGLQNAVISLSDISRFEISQNTALQNINGLSGITEIEGASFFTISLNEALENLDGLENSTIVLSGGDPSSFTINGNQALLDVDGLTNLTQINLVDGSFRITNNAVLSNIDGLSNLAELSIEEGDFEIRTNLNLQNVDGLANASITSSGGRFDISLNAALENINGLSGLNTLDVEDFFNLSNNDALQNIDGLSNLNSLTFSNGSITILGNNSLTDIDGLSNAVIVANNVSDFLVSNNLELINLDGFNGLTELNVGAEFDISNNPQLTNILGLSNTAITLDMNATVSNNPNLISLEGLNVNGDVTSLRISNNDVLEEIVGFNGVTGTLDDFDVSNNPNLQTLSGFNNASLGEFSFLTISNNSLLETCNLLMICQFLADGYDEGVVSINNNAPGCNTPEEVQDICDDCPLDPVVLNSQADVDAFVAQYPDCTKVYGLTIEGENIVDISSLSNLTEIVGDLRVENNILLETLDGLNNVQLLENGDLFVQNNPQLLSLIGLQNLEYANSVFINALPSLSSLEGLNNLSQLESSFTISNCEGIEIINNLDSLESVYDISVSNLPNLSSLQGFVNVNYQELYIENNDSLETLNGLQGNNNQVNFIFIENNEGLINFEGLENLEFVSDLLINNNDALINLAGLNPISVMGLTIIDNENLLNLGGLESLLNGAPFNSVGIGIANNPQLTDISALSNIEDDVVTNFTITGNTLLSQCAIDAVCNNIANDYFLNIENNASGCNSIEEVDMACRPCDFPVVLTSQEEVNNFPVIYADCSVELLNGLTISGDDIVDLSPLSSVESISGILLIEENLLLESLDGLNSLVYVDTMILNGNSQLVDLTAFSLELVIDNLEITSNNSLVNLSGFENVTSINNIILAFNEALVSVEGFPITQTSIGLFELFENPQITNLQGLTNLETATNIHIIGNNSIVNLSGLEGLNLLEIRLLVSANLSLESLEGLDNLVSDLIQPSVEISITNNSLLEDISQLGDMISTSLISLQIEGNTELAICSNVAVCNYLNSGGDASISGNSEGCNSSEEVLDSCGFDLNKISGTIGFDFNNDGCDESDYDTSNILVTTSNADVTLSSITDDNGYFELFVNDGNYISEVVEASLPDGFNASPSTITSEFVGLGNEEEIQFCVLGDPDIQDVSVALIPLQEPRPGEDASYVIQFENKGAQVMSGDITFEYDDAIMFYTGSEVAPDSNNEGVLVWEYEDLLPFESRTFVTSFELFIPPDVVGGEELNSSLVITPLDGDVVLSDNTVGLKEVVVNSYDPNDKQVLQGEEIFEEQVGDYLDYVLRFQNTGTADALNVVVTDTLSNNLNWSTLRILSASHDYRVEITNDNEVAFIFEDINLPPQELDEEGSNGHIAFEIRTVDDLIIGDSVENTANIFFDFNPPIITNTVVTTVAEPLSIDDFVADTIKIYPNPVSNGLNIQFEGGRTSAQISLVSLQGQVVARTETTYIDVAKLSAGVYFLRIETEQGLFIKKIIKR